MHNPNIPTGYISSDKLTAYRQAWDANQLIKSEQWRNVTSWYPSSWRFSESCVLCYFAFCEGSQHTFQRLARTWFSLISCSFSSFVFPPHCCWSRWCMHTRGVSFAVQAVVALAASKCVVSHRHQLQGSEEKQKKRKNDSSQPWANPGDKSDWKNK